MRVLVIEDDPSVGAAIRMTLDREGYDTVITLDAGAGMRAFESFHFDLAIVDIFIRGTSGLATTTGFRRRAPVVPILAMSGFRFRDSNGPKSGFYGYGDRSGCGGLPAKAVYTQAIDDGGMCEPRSAATGCSP